MNTIAKLGRMLREKEISCKEMTVLFIEAAKRLNPELRAYITITEETALTAAEGVDKKLRAGEGLPPLAGIPFVLKDNIMTAGIRTTCASKMLENHIPIFDASVWEYLKNEGAVLIGKGNMDEFAMGSTGGTSYYGAAVNPHDKCRVAGGSSGGVAAAVAAGTAVYGLGSDTGGSIRQPSSFCGVVGLKPTYGAVSRNGLIAFASSLDQIGPIAATVRDAAIVYDAICRHDEQDMTSKGGAQVSGALKNDIRGMRLGVAREFYENLAPDVDRVMNDTLKTLAEMGAELVEMDFPLLRHSMPAYHILSCAEASSNIGRYAGLHCGYSPGTYDDIDDYTCRARSEGFGAEVRRRATLGTLVLGPGYYDAYYKKALLLKNAIKNEFKRLFGQCDCLVVPTVPITAMKSGSEHTMEAYQTDMFTAAANIAGLPAVSSPCGFDGAGLPVGMQIIGDKFEESSILSVALAFETQTAGAFNKTLGMVVEL